MHVLVLNASIILLGVYVDVTRYYYFVHFIKNQSNKLVLLLWTYGHSNKKLGPFGAIPAELGIQVEV